MKKALILGGNSSVGKEIISEFLNNQYLVISTLRTIKNNNSNNIKKLKYIKLDFSNKKYIDQFFETIKNEKFDFFTSTISNKPILNKFENLSLDIFENDLKVNVLNHIYFIQKLIPLMNPKSNILLILSEMVCNDKLKFTSSYQISKFALLGLMKVLSGELKSKQITVNSISPGLMETNFTSDVPKFIKENYLKNSGNNKLITPNDVAKKLITIIKDKNINGENIELF